jgi:multicomponent Na+:H+ antiporter subunit A
VRAPQALSGLNADRFYDAAFAGLGRLAETMTRLIQNGHLHTYVRATLIVLTLILFGATVRASVFDADTWRVSMLDAVVASSIICCAIATLFLRSAIAAVAVLGGIGFVMALLFVLYGAPDVAMTQFAVETLIVIIFVLVIYHLPRLRQLTSWPRRVVDAVIAGAFGATMGILAYAAATRDVPRPVSEEHAIRSVSEGFGRNVVNVILVDFRALDTLGEIFVLGIAAIGVYTLLRLRNGTQREALP